MIQLLKPPGNNPWSKLSKWEAFGDKYDAIDFNRKFVSEETINWIESKNLQFSGGSMLTIFPEKKPPVLVDSPWCTQDNHARLYWVYEAPVEFIVYELTEEPHPDNYEKLLGVKPDCEEHKFKSPFTGWYPKPEILREVSRIVVQPNTLSLVNAGSPILAVAASPVRAKVFAISLEKKGRINPSTRTIPFEEAKEYFKEDYAV